jgi:hypothetical protein
MDLKEAERTIDPDGIERATPAIDEDTSSGPAPIGLTARVHLLGFAVGAALTVYPVLFMWPALGPRGRTHLRNEWAEPDLLTDLDGAVRLAYVLKHMAWPWSSSSVTAVPTGESIWRWQQVSQGVQTLALWALTQVFQPTFSVNLIVLIAWVTTGLAGYALARWLGASIVMSLAVGVLCQMMPSIPTMASNYTSYVFLAVPLLGVGAGVAATTAPSWRRFAVLLGALGLAAFFDPYWFFFSLLSVAVSVAVNHQIIRAWVRTVPSAGRAMLAVTAVAPALLIAVVVALDRRSTATSTSRPLGVASSSFVNAGLRDITDWTRSSFEGVGNLIPLIALVFGVVVIRRGTDRRMITIAAVCAAMFLASTRTSVDLNVIEIRPLAEYLRFAMPGVRFFQRAALIAEALMCVLAVFAVRDATRALRRGWQRGTAAFVAAGLVVLSLTPADGRAVFQPSPAYEGLRERLGATNDATVVAVPLTKAGRSWFELSLLDVPSVNSLVAREPGRLVVLAASQGPGALAAHLTSVGVTHLLAVSGESRLPTTYELDAPRFEEVDSFEASGFEGPDAVITVYEVHAMAGDRFCERCGLGNELALLRPAELTGDVYGREVLQSGAEAWWVRGQRAVMRPTSTDSAIRAVDNAFDATLSVKLGNVPCGTAREVRVRHVDFDRTFSLSGIEPIVVELPVTAATVHEPIRFDVDGPECEIEIDDRQFMLQIFEPELVVSQR